MIAHTLNPPRGSLRERDNRYYHLLAGGAKTRLLEALLDLQIPELLGSQGPLTASQICRELSLDPHRGWKFLHLLALSGMLIEEDGDRGQDEARYSLSDEAKEYFGPRVYQTAVPRNVRLAEAPSFGKPIVLYDAESQGARSYLSLAREILSRAEGSRRRTARMTGT